MDIKWSTKESIKSIDENSWNSLQRQSFPFQLWHFHLALEQSGCIGPGTGWLPKYLIATIGEKLVCALPCYEKTNSNGEYIFDWEFAALYQRAGVAYYPKLISAIPFSPVVGPKFLLAKGLTLKDIKDSFEKYLKLFSAPYSSLHLLFNTNEEFDIFKDHWQQRKTFQFHWSNNNYQSFTDFLKRLKKNRRKTITKERLSIAKYGLEINFKYENFNQSDIDLTWQCYLSTIDKKEAIDYLNKDFFNRIFSSMPENILLVQALKDGIPIAQSFSLMEDDKLYGRYWGQVLDTEFKFLHFELCYYALIDFCIKRKMTSFEAGAQGGHKLLRGFDPVVTKSLHQFFDDRLGPPICQFLKREALGLEKELAMPENFTAYRP